MNWWLIGLGLFVHLVFFYSIFDIYFTSPLVHGMRPHRTSLKPPAERLVLYVADGLRADKLFELDDTEHSRAPFLRDVMEYHGVWGVSHTRVPTESRPGHVALIAGFYEDVSAVAKGWKENPVEFDSLFNKSRYTWSWGSPDILPMFSKGASGDHMFTKMYPAESEDFAGSHLANLDTWVFDNVKELFSVAKENSSLNEMLHKDKVVLFLHLLGLDTNGHAHRPYSQEYMENIRLVDDGIKELDALIEEFYGRDGKTAYILTSDHGMTAWGSHGAGHPSETLTPLVAWGAGIRKPQSVEESFTFEFDGFSEDWKLDHLKRSDINQADVCPLMASLLGIDYPVNSVGILPVDYLETSDLFKAESLFTNAREIVAQFEVKMAMRKQTTLSLFFTPYKPLTPSKITANLRNIRDLIRHEKFEEAIFYSQSLIQQSLEGLNYYHNYDRFFLGVSITLGFVGWMSYIALIMFQSHTDIVRPQPKIDHIYKPFYKSAKGIRLIFLSIAIVVISLLYIQSLPWTYYVYCLIPVILWQAVFQRLDVVVAVWQYINDHGLAFQAGLTLGLGVIGLEIIVMSFHTRELLSVGLLGIAFWPLSTPLRESYQKLAYGWLVSCLLLAVFPLLPVVGRDAHYALVIVAGCLIFVIGLTCMLRPEARIFLSNKADADLTQVRILTLFQLGLVAVAIYIVRSTALSIGSKKGLPNINQVASWTILVMAFVLPLLSSTKLYTRLLNISLAFLPTYLLLSTSHEALFVIALCLLLFCWLQVEHRLNRKKMNKLTDLDFVAGDVIGHSQRYLQLTDVRIAYFFVFLLIVAFFGTGNIASINSFDPASVYCFLTVFSPFVMGALMLWKVLIPFLLVTCIFNAVHITVNVPTQSLLLVVMLMSDFMALNFFFQVRDYGSWLEIGASISHYVIVMSTICFMLILMLVSKAFTSLSVRLIKHKVQ